MLSSMIVSLPKTLRRTTRTALAIVLLSGSAASAHSWYDPACCDDRDCVPVAVTTVTATSEGWHVRLEPGQHPFATGVFEEIVPYGDRKERMSQDGDFHACLSPGGYLFCLYVPPMSF